MKTYVILILDKSGSMDGQRDKNGIGEIRKRTLNDLNEKIQMYRNEAKLGEQEILFCFVSFNNHLDEHLWLKEANQVQDGTLDDYEPNGGTALNDAIVYTLNKAQETIKLEDDDAVVVCILTDGDENASRLYPKPKGDIVVKQIIQRLEGLKNSKGQQQWTITYLGANQNVEEVAERYGLQPANCALYSTDDVASVSLAYNHYNQRAYKYLRSRSMGFTGSGNFASDDDKVADWTSE